MSATSRQIEFGVTVQDPDHWSLENRAAVDAEPGGSYDDWVVEKLETVMRGAGDRFIAANPDLFHGDLT